MTRGEVWGLVVVVAAALAVRVGFALTIAPLQAPDEAAHVQYAEHLAATRRLPVAPPPQPRMFADPAAQSYQPPLAYALLAPTAGLLAAVDAPPPLRVRALRLQNAGVGAATAVAGFAVAARLTPAGDPRRLLVAALLGLFPGFAANAAVVNNDALANLLCVCLWLPLLGVGRARALGAGAVLGAACLAKLSALALTPLLLVVPLCQDIRRPGRAVRNAALGGMAAAALMAPWLARNQRLYGHPLAIGVGSMSFEWLATLLPNEVVAALARPHPLRVLAQFWGHFGIYNNLRWPPLALVLAPIVVLALLGWARPSGAPDPRYRRAAAAAGVAVLLAVAGLVSFSLRYHAAWQGRYLYTAMCPIALLVAGGLTALTPKGVRVPLVVLVIALLLALDTAAILRLGAFFATVPPSRWAFPATL